MRVLVACEESQAVCIAFRERGHEAYSCDILPCSGGHPEWHIQFDVLKIMNTPAFLTQNNDLHIIMDGHTLVNGWDMMIAFPPCTHLAVSGAAWFEQKRKDGRQQEGIDFFMKFTQTDIPKWAIENPVGIMSKLYRKPDQIIQPYYFGDETQKTTCLWLNNLPPLFHANKPDLFNDKITHVDKGEFYEWKDGKTGKTKKQPLWYANAFLKRKEDNQGFTRSKTFPGIARAMAEQWGC